MCLSRVVGLFFVQADKANKRGKIMIISLECASPFYAAYAAQADIINAAIERAIEESAAKMGSSVTEIYSVSASAIEEKLAA